MTDLNEKIRQDWESQANGWYEERDYIASASRPIADWLVEHVEPQAGKRILEVAAGPGDTGFLAARRLGNTGRLVSTDFSPTMVEAARKRGAELGITNAEYQVLDAQAMELPDESVDGVICRWGFMLMPDPQQALRESRRVLKPGGRLAFAVFTAPSENSFAALPAQVLTQLGFMPPPSGTWQPGILALADRTRLQTLLDGAGFASTHIEPVDMAWTFRDTAGYWDFLVELTAIGPLVRTLSDADQQAVRKAIDERLAAFTNADGIRLPSRCWCGLAIR